MGKGWQKEMGKEGKIEVGQEEEGACGEAAGRDGGLAAGPAEEEPRPWAEEGMREERREGRDLRGRV